MLRRGSTCVAETQAQVAMFVHKYQRAVHGSLENDASAANRAAESSSKERSSQANSQTQLKQTDLGSTRVQVVHDASLTCKFFVDTAEKPDKRLFSSRLCLCPAQTFQPTAKREDSGPVRLCCCTRSCNSLKNRAALHCLTAGGLECTAGVSYVLRRNLSHFCLKVSKTSPCQPAKFQLQTSQT